MFAPTFVKVLDPQLPIGFMARAHDVALPGPLCIVRGAQVSVRGALGEQVLDDARECVGGGDDGCFGAQAGSHPPGEGPQALVAAADRLRREPKRWAGAVAGRQRAPA
jgi:cell wall-associated NlpC family hydrolase